MPNQLRAFDALIGRKLNAARALSPWDRGSQALSPSAAWRLEFGDLDLLCVSPLRLRSSQKGSTFGLDNGDWVSFGFRVHLADSESPLGLHASAVPCSACADHAWTRLHGVPPIGHTLMEIRASNSDLDGWVMKLLFEGGAECHMRYRPDLDGSLEFAKVGLRHTIGEIKVSTPLQPFGWLHPAARLPFVLGNQRWASAALRDWPFHLRKAMRNAPNPEEVQREILMAAMRARFQQSPHWMRRLAHVAYPVTCPDCPSNIYEALMRLPAQRLPHA